MTGSGSGTCFNPRPRVGGDDPNPNREERRNHVSIRAPAWGATSTPGESGAQGDGFNPRPRVGGDRHEGFWLPVQACFNPRPRVGGDGSTVTGSGSGTGFNPRPRVGGDAGRSVSSGQVNVSIRAPAWGATALSGCLSKVVEFQSAPPRGGRRDRRHHRPRPGPCFNPRPRVGGDLIGLPGLR